MRIGFLRTAVTSTAIAAALAASGAIAQAGSNTGTGTSNTTVASAQVASPPQPAANAKATSPSPPANPFDQDHRNWVVVPSVGLSQELADYTDCSGQAAVPRNSGARDWCSAANVVYLVGHNPGDFTPFLRVHTGDLVRYWDKNGDPTTYRFTAVTQASRAQAILADNGGAPALVVQTCAVLDGSIDWIYVAVPV